jgi:hypothetical protein
MLSSQEEQAERRRVFAQDQSIPRQATTFHQHALADAQTPRGRFSAEVASYVVGSKPDAASAYPAAAAHQRDPVPIEPSLGYRIDDLNPSDPVELSSFTQQAPDPTSADAPNPLGQRADVGSLSSENMAAQRMSQMSSSSTKGDGVRTERPPAYRRF